MSDTKTREALAAEIERIGRGWEDRTISARERGSWEDIMGSFCCASWRDLLVALRPAEPAQARADVLEIARLVAHPIMCLTCGAVFCGEDQHPEPECSRPNWDHAPAEKLAAHIRALALQQKDAAS